MVRRPSSAATSTSTCSSSRASAAEKRASPSAPAPSRGRRGQQLLARLDRGVGQHELEAAAQGAGELEGAQDGHLAGGATTARRGSDSKRSTSGRKASTSRQQLAIASHSRTSRCRSTSRSTWVSSERSAPAAGGVGPGLAIAQRPGQQRLSQVSLQQHRGQAVPGPQGQNHDRGGRRAAALHVAELQQGRRAPPPAPRAAAAGHTAPNSEATRSLIA